MDLYGLYINPYRSYKYKEKEFNFAYGSDVDSSIFYNNNQR